MDLIKITLFLACLVLSRCDEKLTGFLGDDKDFEDAEFNVAPVTPSRRFFVINKPKQGCICVPPAPSNAKKVSEMLHPLPGSSELRLVVYIFKNSVTGEYKIYVPNKAKQLLFPDISYDLYEIFRSVTDKFSFNKVLFNIHTWITLKTKPLPKPTPTTTPKPKPKPTTTPKPKPLPTTTTPKPIHISPEKPKIIDSSEIIAEIINNSDQAKINGLFGYLNRFKETKRILGTLTGRTFKDKLLQLKRLHPNIYTQFVTKITKFYPIWLIKGNIIRFKPGQLQNFPYDIKLLPVLNGKRVIINGQLKPHRSVEEILIYSPKQSILKNLFPGIDVNSHLLFDEWLKIMVMGLQNQIKFASKIIDFVALKSFVLNILHKHQFTVTAEGWVFDSYGRKINLSNIILRPILMGESSLINSVINNGLFRIPSGIIFLEALLTSANSVKSLGIVPLSHIFMGYREEVISQSTTVQIVETIKTCENNICSTKKICKNLQGHEEPCKDFSKMRSGEPESEQSREALEIPTADPSTPEPFIVMDKSGNVMATAAEAEASASEGHLPIDEEPGIRIIGGQPATLSGPPVNVKGRSIY